MNDHETVKAPSGVFRLITRTPALLGVLVVLGISLKVLAPELHTAMCTLPALS